MSEEKELKLAARMHLLMPETQPDVAASDRKGVQSVEQAFSLLSIVESSAGSVSVTDIAQALGSSPSKVHHYIVSLVRCGALRQTGRGTYDLGTTCLGLGLSALSRLDTVGRTCEEAESLRDTIGESVFVSVWGNRGPTTIRYFEGLHVLSVEARAGLVLPLLTSATGHVFLTWKTPSSVAPIIEQERGTEAKVNALRERTQSAGLGRVDGDLLPRIAALSAPVFTHNEGLSHAVTVLGWSSDCDYSKDGKIAQALRKLSVRLSREFGGSTN